MAVTVSTEYTLHNDTYNLEYYQNLISNDSELKSFS